MDYLKIDGVFIRDIVNDPIDYAMVKSIHEIGHVTGMQTIAEFVEDDAIRAKLAEIGVDFVQGYGISIPQPVEEVAVEYHSFKPGGTASNKATASVHVLEEYKIRPDCPASASLPR